MMPAHITEYSWKVFKATEPPSAYVRPRFESWDGGDDGRVTIRMFGKEFVYSAEWSKYPPEAHPAYEPLKDAPAEIAKFLRRQLKKKKKGPGVLKRLLIRIDLLLSGHHTYCDGCKKFSPSVYCPYC